MDPLRSTPSRIHIPNKTHFGSSFTLISYTRLSTSEVTKVGFADSVLPISHPKLSDHSFFNLGISDLGSPMKVL